MPEIYSPAEDSYLLAEILAKKLPRILRKNKKLTFFEMGCGSGIILEKALDLGVKRENILSADVNKDSVKHCKNLGFKCVHSNLFDKVKRKFDVIVFNPPYLPIDERESKNSRLITTGGKTGSEITNKFLKQAKKHLKENGVIFLLVSSHTRKIDFSGFRKKIAGRKKLFFEMLFVLELRK